MQSQDGIPSRVADEAFQAFPITAFRPEGLNLFGVHVVLLHFEKLSCSVSECILLQTVGGADDGQEINYYSAGDGDVGPIHDLAHVPGISISADP